mgnify:CR=1 FL=1
MRRLVKSLLDHLPPALALPVATTLRRLGASRAVRARLARADAIAARLGGDTVRAGPFAGMRYRQRAVAQGGFLPKLLGSYERELHPTWRSLAGGQWRTVIDVGAAEGYYAVGLARLLPGCTVHAFEMERPLHAAIGAMARENGAADRVHVHGRCTSAMLGSMLTDRATAAATLLVMDCEGAEDVLLDLVAAPGLAHATIVVEVHDALVPGVGVRLRERFAMTHDVIAVPTESRGVADLPPGVTLGEEDRALALDEGRGGPMEWLVCRPRT